MTATADTGLISTPGVYDLPPDVYHRDPVAGGSLSSSGARKLIPPSCPAKFRAWADGEQEFTPALNFGRAAHTRVLGVGDPVEVMAMRDGRTKDGKADIARRAELISQGITVISPEEDETINAMAAALRAHPVASALLDPSAGKAEQTLVWQDQATGVWCRALIDWLPDSVPGQRLIVVDYKTGKSAEPGAIGRSVWDFGYHCQGEWYLDGIRALGLAGPIDPAFVFVFQEKTPPYIVTVIQLDVDAQRWAQAQIAAARRIYRECMETGVWPGYADDEVVSVPLPRFATNQLEDLAMTGLIDAPEGAFR